MKLTKREYFSLELAKAAISNTNSVSLSSEQLARNCVADADALIARLAKAEEISKTIPLSGIVKP